MYVYSDLSLVLRIFIIDKRTGRQCPRPKSNIYSLLSKLRKYNGNLYLWEVKLLPVFVCLDSQSFH